MRARPKRLTPQASAGCASADDGHCDYAKPVVRLTPMKQFCKIHPETKLRVIVYCPACRGALGGAKSGKTMTAEEKTKRAKKAARARWKAAKK